MARLPLVPALRRGRADGCRTTSSGSPLEDAKAAALRAELEWRAAELGIAPGDVFAWLRQQMPVGKGTRTRKPRGDIGAKRAAKYRGPNGEEWSGRGRTPKWLAVLEAEGRG